MDNKKVQEHRELLAAVREMIYDTLVAHFGEKKVVRRSVDGEAVITLNDVRVSDVVKALKRTFK